MSDKGEVEWAVMRPTWFQQNCSTQAMQLKAIKEESRIYSAIGLGRMPPVSTYDVAAVATYALTAIGVLNRHIIIIGPGLLSYTQLAETVSSVLGRKITDHKLTPDELAEKHMGFGLPPNYARSFTGLDTMIRGGGEDRINDVV